MVEITHIWTILDRMRETQITHTALLQGLLDGQKSADQILSELRQKKKSGVIAKSAPLLKPIAGGALNYAVGLLMMAHILRGGSILDILKLLLPS